MAQTKNVNMTPNDTLPRLHLSQYDVGRELSFSLCDGAVTYSVPTGATVKLMGTKPSGFGFVENCTVSGSTASISTTSDMTDEWGAVACELVVEKSGIRLGSTNLLLVIEKSPHPEGTTDGSQETIIPTLTLLVERIEAAAASVNDLTVSATTLEPGSDATAVFDPETDSIAFGIPRGADGSVTPEQFNGAVSDLENTLSKYNAVNFLQAEDNRTHNGITWTKVVGAKVTATGSTTNAVSFYNYFSNTSALPDWAEAGGTYRFTFAGTNVSFRVMYYNGTSWVELINTKTNGKFTIPTNATGLIVRCMVTTGVTNVNETVEPIIMSTKSNAEIVDEFAKYLNIVAPIAINSGDDLDDYTTPNSYASQSASVTMSLSHVPNTLPQAAFMLIVIKTIGGTPSTRRIRQFVLSEAMPSVTNGAAKIYTRIQPTDNSWTDWVELASVESLSKAQNDLNIFKSVTATLVKAIDFITDGNGITYGAQGMTATDDYIVIGLDAINTEEHPDVNRKYNGLLILNKDDYSVADLPENPIFKTVDDYEGVETCHMANLSWDSEADEIYIRTVSGGVSNDITIVIDASTFEIKRYADLNYPGAFDYDNITQRWAFNHYNTPATSDTLRIANKGLTSATPYTFARQGTTQGMLYYDGVAFVPSSCSECGNNNIRVTDSSGHLISDWYFPNNTGASEFEDLAAISSNKILLSTNSNGQYRLFEIIYRPFNTYFGDIKAWDGYINSSIDMGS